MSAIDDDVKSCAETLATSATWVDDARCSEVIALRDKIAAAIQAERDRWRRMSLHQWKLSETQRAETAEARARELEAQLAATRERTGRVLVSAFAEPRDTEEA